MKVKSPSWLAYTIAVQPSWSVMKITGAHSDEEHGSLNSGRLLHRNVYHRTILCPVMPSNGIEILKIEYVFYHTWVKYSDHPRIATGWTHVQPSYQNILTSRNTLTIPGQHMAWHMPTACLKKKKTMSIEDRLLLYCAHQEISPQIVYAFIETIK